MRERKNKFNRFERRGLLRKFEEKYRDLVWYYATMAHRPGNLKGHPGFERSLAIKRKHPNECAQLLLKEDGMWFHGFNSGCLAACRYAAGLHGNRREQDQTISDELFSDDPFLDTEGGE